MSEVTISASIPEDLHQQVAYLARLLRRDPSWVFQEALRCYVATETKFAEAVAEGIRAGEAGDVVPHETVMKEMDDLIASYRIRKK